MDKVHKFNDSLKHTKKVVTHLHRIQGNDSNLAALLGNGRFTTERTTKINAGFTHKQKDTQESSHPSDKVPLSECHQSAVEKNHGSVSGLTLPQNRIQKNTKRIGKKCQNNMSTEW